MSEEQIKFISACIIQSLSYLRMKKIINRDIRMKNLIMDKKKYFNLIDFSFAIKYCDKNNSKNYIIGNKNESAPEIINHDSYDYNSDYYRIGIIIYYLIFKKYANIVKKESKINEIFLEHKDLNNYTVYCLDFLNKLLITDYQKRIGFRSINELKNHIWFKGFNWSNFEKKQIKSPFKFFKKKKKKNYCSKFNFSTITFIKKNNIYLKIIKNYDYVNRKIIINIFNILRYKI